MADTPDLGSGSKEWGFESLRAHQFVFDERKVMASKFEEILPGTYLLKVPFGVVWTGIVLVKGESNFLIDSSHLEPEECLMSALTELGLTPGDINWLLNTHVHGDHIGGHHTLVTKYGIKAVTFHEAATALRDPVNVAIRVRTRFPKNSPPPQSYLKGVDASVLMEEDELLSNRFQVVTTPGHDDDCLCWIDTHTKTAFTGDSLQANGTPTQGIAFYRSLAKYRDTLNRFKSLDIENIVCGHDYDGIGSVIIGRDAVNVAIAKCEEYVNTYAREIESIVRTQGINPAAAADDEDLLVPIALQLIDKVGCGRPQSLFLALHTVSEHLKEMKEVV